MPILEKSVYSPFAQKRTIIIILRHYFFIILAINKIGISSGEMIIFSYQENHVGDVQKTVAILIDNASKFATKGY